MGGLWKQQSRGYVVKSCHSHFQILNYVFSGCSVEFSAAVLDLPNLVLCSGCHLVSETVKVWRDWLPNSQDAGSPIAEPGEKNLLLPVFITVLK